MLDYYVVAEADVKPEPLFEPRKYESLPSTQTLQSLPPEHKGDILASIRDHVQSGPARVLVMLDDDPTGTQTCHDIAVLTVWDHDTLCKELRADSSGFFILTNSRALPPDQAYELICTITTNLARAAHETKREFEIVLRGDSTLRGHLPQEPDAVEAILGRFDGWVIAPFFFQGGRYTINDVHYVKEDEMLIPASGTAFAKDASFGYKSSNLRDYIREKCGPRFDESAFMSVSIDDIRTGGPQRVADVLCSAPKEGIVIVNAAAESDMFVFAAGLLEAEKTGKRFLFRTGAAFVSARLGITPIAPLTMQDLGVQVHELNTGGLIVAGSYVPKTTAQLARLRQRRGDRLHVLEMDVEDIINPSNTTANIAEMATLEANEYLKRGKDVLIMTSRKLITGGDSISSLHIGSKVAETLVRVVQNINVRPRYIIAKGGITSSDAATKGLRMERAMVVGQAAAGVPLWVCNEETSRHKGVPYVVFPGNVGSEDTLADVVELWGI